MPEAISTVGFLVGYAMLNAAARSGTAVSREALAVRRSASAVVQSAESSIALFGGKSQAISQIWFLVAECNKPGWNGEEAPLIDEVAADLAVDFIRALPDVIPLPEFSPEPDGALSLDWIASRHRLFSLSIGRTNRLAYAWIDGADRGHGVTRFDGEKVPLRILQGIIDIVRQKNASVWIA